MSEMVERVKSAMIEALKASDEDGVIGPYGHSGERLTLDGHFDMEAIARAVVAAMRLPTEAMEAAGIAKDDYLEWLQQDRAIPQVYTAMIDAALAPPSEE